MAEFFHRDTRRIRNHDRPQALHGAHRIPLPALRRASRPHLRRCTGADRPALLQQRRRAAIHTQGAGTEIRLSAFAAMSRGLSLVACLVAAGLAGCFTIGDSKVPIGTVSLPAFRPAVERTLIIVLPGLGDDAQDMKDHGLAEVIRESWP